MSKFVFFTALLFLTSCYSKHIDRGDAREIQFDNSSKIAVARWVTTSRGCSYFECGESPSKLLKQWLEIEVFSRKGKLQYKAIIDCAIDDPCFDQPVRYGVCGKRFIPMKNKHMYIIGDRRADRISCKPSEIVII
jgi:hypothetical protein